MLLARVFSKIYKKDSGIILIDAKGQKYFGNPSKDNPITLKLMKESLNGN